MRGLLSAFVSVAAGVLLLSASAAAGGNGWDDAANGEHSLQKLGPDFYVPLSMKKVDGAKLTLFNYEAAQRLGLPVPKDPKELEKLVLDHFAYMVDKGGKGDKQWMATRYLDSGKKAPGEALGDGRAAWSGELALKQADGSVVHVDFVLKGVGQTPLAWTNHNEVGHKDGFQSMEEAVHSFIQSEANVRNNLDSTVDLAVIEIPTNKIDKHTGRAAKAAITVRVGNQTRLAHFRYFADEPQNFKKIFEYALKRDMRLPPDTVVTKEHVEQYMESFVRNISEEAARYFDLHAVHAAPTYGNRTTQGSTIDMGTWRYLDAHHEEYTYLYDKLKLSGQTDQLLSYQNGIFEFMRKAGYDKTPSPEFEKKMHNLFISNSEEKLTDQWLRRLGLSAEEIAKVKPANRRKLFDSMISLAKAKGASEVKIGDRKFLPAAYDMRKVTENTMSALSLPEKESKKALAEAFENDRSWSTTKNGMYKSERAAYEDAVRRVIGDVSPDKTVNREWITRAQLIGQNERLEVGRANYEKNEKPIIQMIEEDKPFDQISGRAFQSAETFVDPALLPRPRTNLGRKLKIAVYSGTFDPPHGAHREMIRNLKEALGVDVVYIVPNVESEHKAGVLPYEHRAAMSKLEFGKLDGVVVADPDLAAAFKRGDMAEVLRVVNEKNPGAKLYQVMGDDSYARYLKVQNKPKLDNLTIVVNKREGNIEIPRVGPDGTPAIVLDTVSPSSSSSKMKNLLAAGIEPPELDPWVIEYMKANRLYGLTPESVLKPAVVEKPEAVIAGKRGAWACAVDFMKQKVFRAGK